MPKCIHIGRSRGDLFLTPYLGEGSIDPKEDVVILSGGQLDEKRRDRMSIAIYSDIDYSVDRWIMDKRYVPRVFLSAIGFLVSYFFCSLVIRDPIPMVDELVVSSVVAFFLWRSAARHDTKSAKAQNLRDELKDKAALAMVQIDESLFKVETFLEEMEKMDTRVLSQSICGGTLPALEKNETLGTLLAPYAAVHARATHAWYDNLTRGRKRNDLHVARLSNDIIEGKVDGPLLALMVALSS